MSSWDWRRLALLALLAVAAAIGGYALGHSRGADLEAARADGAAAGKRAGLAAGAERGHAAGLKRGNEVGYRQAYKRAYQEGLTGAASDQGKGDKTPGTSSD